MGYGPVYIVHIQKNLSFAKVRGPKIEKNGWLDLTVQRKLVKIADYTDDSTFYIIHGDTPTNRFIGF